MILNHFKAMTIIPKIHELIKDVIDYCDGAWIINLSAPIGIINESVYRYSEYEKFVGLSQSPLKMKEQFFSNDECATQTTNTYCCWT